MNLFTREIAQYLEISLDKAVKVQDFIDTYLDLDWSEATQQELEITYRLAEKLMKEEASK